MIQLDDEKMFPPILNNPLKIQQLPDRTVVDFYMPNVIEENADEYIDFFRAIDDLRPNDEVNIHINCYGGEASTAFQIVDHIYSTQANVNIAIEGNCCSAATFVALAGDSWDVMPHCRFMCHAYSKVEYGKRNEVFASHEFDKIWLDDSIREIYKGFLTDEEIEKMLDGKDYWFTANEVIERLNKYKHDDFEKQKVVNEVIERHQKSINDEIEKRLADYDKQHAKKPTQNKPKQSKPRQRKQKPAEEVK